MLNKKTREVVGYNLEAIGDANGAEKYIIQFKYTNRFGKILLTPAVTISKEDMNKLIKHVQEF